MVNEDFKTFTKVQHEHQGIYLGKSKGQKPGVNDGEYNNQDNTDKAIGAIGRDL